MSLWSQRLEVVSEDAAFSRLAQTNSDTDGMIPPWVVGGIHCCYLKLPAWSENRLVGLFLGEVR